MDKVYIFSDLHGNYDLWSQIRDYADESDVLICLGDSIDRGKDGLKILEELISDERSLLILGNHEEMMLKYINAHLDGLSIDESTWSNHWIMNGGAYTMSALREKGDSDPAYFIKIKEAIEDMPKLVEYDTENGNLLSLSHAGFNPWITDTMFYSDFRNENNRYIWDRLHISFPAWKGNENNFIIHGHTPCQMLMQRRGFGEDGLKIPVKAISYCDGHKIDIDLGTHHSHRACLFEAESLEVVKYFEETIPERNGGE